MQTRRTWTCGALVLAAAALGACSSETANDRTQPAPAGAGATTPGDPPATDASGSVDTAAPAADDICSTIPDLATIEAAIGVGVINPLGVGEPGSSQTCTLQRATDEFPGITLTVVPGGTIANQTTYLKSNFDIDLVPLDGAAGFYAGEGDSVYYEADGNLYQTSAVIDGDSRTASLNLMKAWLGL